MRIAIITAMAEETMPIFQSLGSSLVDESTISGVVVRKFALGADTIYLATSGVGEIKAALAVQLLKDLFDVDAVLNFGFVGAISSALNIAELVIAARVCHYQFDISAINDIEVGRYSDHEDKYFYLDNNLIATVLANVGKQIRHVTVASGDKFISSSQDKEMLRDNFGANVCDMELAGLAIACERNSLPLLSLKVVSDKADESATADFEEIVHLGMHKLADILPDVLKALEGITNTRTPARRR